MTRQITIDIVGNADSFSRATDNAIDQANKVDHSLRNTAVGGAVAGVAFAGVNKAIDFVTDALAGASEAATEDQASQDRLKLAYDNTGRAQKLSVDAIEAVISANQAKGVSDSEQRQGISDFLDLTKNATEAMQLNQAVVELAAAKGLDYAAAEAMIRSAAAGKTAALEKAGVAVEKGASAVQIATAVEDKFGGSLDRVATTQGGKSKINAEKMGEAQEKLGRVINRVAEVVMPAVADAMTFVIDNVIPPLADAFEAIAPVVSKVFGIIAAVIQRVVPIVRTYFGILGNVIDGLVKAFSAIATVVSRVFGGIGAIIRGAINVVVDVVNGVIRAINGIQVHVHVGPVNLDWNGLNLGYLPRLHTGGIVPGQPGADVLALLQAGERVVPAGAGAGTPMIQIVIAEGAYIDGPGIDMLTNRIAQRLQFASGG